MVIYTLKEKILKFLIENKESSYSIMNISKGLKADYKNTSQALSNIDSEIYFKMKHGNSYSIKFNQNNNIKTLLVEDKRTEEFILKNPDIKVVKKYVEELNYPFLIFLVFGSYVKNTKTKGSDIDVCIILDNKIKSIKLHEKLNLLSLNLEVQEFTSKEFVSMIEKREIGRASCRERV